MASKVDTVDTQILELIKDTRLQQVLILHLEGKSAKEIADEVGSVAKQAISLLGDGRGKLNQVDHEVLYNAVHTHMTKGMSLNLAIWLTVGIVGFLFWLGIHLMLIGH